MDPYSFDIDTVKEHRLRRHIHDVLLPYARVHLTSDHAAFTEVVLEELLLQTLEYVPMADATSFLLPIDPFEVLMGSLDSLDLNPPEEKWAIPSEYVRYLRTFFPCSPCPADLRAERCWHEDDDCYMRLSLMCRPISPPVLSKRARRETPMPGNTGSRTSIPRTRPALSAFLDLHSVSAQHIEDLPAPPIDDVLDLRFKLNSDIGAGMRPLLQSVLGPPMREKYIDCSEIMLHVSGFLSCDSPPRCLPILDSPPLFTRVVRGQLANRGPRNNTESGVSNPVYASDLAFMLQVASPELVSEDGDTNDHHMRVVDGWTTLALSSPPPAFRPSSALTEVDELWDVSPPGTPTTSLIAAKMDEVEIPRVRKFGHKNTLVNETINDRGTANLLTNSPGFFITSFISAPVPITQATKPITAQVEGVKHGMHIPRPFSPGQSSSNSLLGQPPSALEAQANEETPAEPANRAEGFEEQRFDDAVASIYASTPQDPLYYIREEKLDDKEMILMDVPNLPPPTVHPKEIILFPQGMHNFIAPKGEAGHPATADHTSNDFGSMPFLQPAKGIKPLALDLSWRPFNFGKSVPTDEEVAGIANSIQPEDEAPGYLDDKYQQTARTLLDLGISVKETLISTVPPACEGFGTSPPTHKYAGENGHVEYLLSRRERTRVSGCKIGPEAETRVQDDSDTQYDATRSYNNEDNNIFVLDKNLLRDDAHQGSQIPFVPEDCGSQSWTDHGYFFDDSGIDVMDNSHVQFFTNGCGTPAVQNDSLAVADPSGTNKENINCHSENKENVPLWEADDTLENHYDWTQYVEFPESEAPSFEPLSFASQNQLEPSDYFTNSKTQDKRPLTPNGRLVQHDFSSMSESGQTDSRATKRRKLEDLVPASSKDLFSAFIGLRGQVTSSGTLEHSETRNDIPTPQTQIVPEQILPRTAPDDVFDPHTVRLPEHWIPATAVHRYLASVSLIQKRALVHELQGRHCRVVLVERYDLGGTDIIIDPDYGVLFMPLFALPAHLDSAIDRISRESWRYLNLLLVLEAFPSARSYRVNHARDNRPAPYAYTPPICNAIKKLRRNLGIAEGCGTMNPRCTVTWAFANDVEEAAKFVRCFGEQACASSMELGHGTLWDERAWLEEEEREGESDLAKVHGMNAFASFVMLYDTSLEAIFALSPEARLANFGQLVGQERVMGLNATIESRMQQIGFDLADSTVDPDY